MKTRAIDRQQISARLSGLLNGSLPEGEFMRWLSLVEVGEAEIESHDAPLVAQLINLCEDESIGAHDRRELTMRYASLLQSRLSNDDVMQIFPLLTTQDRLCEVARKWKAGVLAQTSFASFLRSSPYAASLKGWMARATPERLSYLCRTLVSSDYEETINILRTNS